MALMLLFGLRSLLIRPHFFGEYIPASVLSVGPSRKRARVVVIIIKRSTFCFLFSIVRLYVLRSVHLLTDVCRCSFVLLFLPYFYYYYHSSSLALVSFVLFLSHFVYSFDGMEKKQKISECRSLRVKKTRRIGKKAVVADGVFLFVLCVCARI